MRTLVCLTAYASTIPVANWMIDNVGTQHGGVGPHVIPVGFGYSAPSGVLAIGAALALRDAVHAMAGRRVAVFAVFVGCVLSYVLADAAIASASLLAFALGEAFDLTIYSAVQRRSRALAVLASGLAGAVVDSLVFLRVAFGSSQFWQGQVIGKTYVTLAASLAVWTASRAVSHRLAARTPRPVPSA